MNRPLRTATRTLHAAVLAAVLAVLLAPAAALAAAGGGSSGFSGGGGGGGGGFSGGGGGSGGGFSGGGGGSSGPGDVFIGVLILIAVVVFVIYWLYRQAVTAFVRERLRVRRNKRVKRVHTAAAEAAEDDPDFAADRVTAGAEQLFRDVQVAWDARDRDKLAHMVGADLLVEWTRRLDDFKRKGWRNRVSVMGDVNVEYVGLTNRAEDAEDRCVVRIHARLKDYVVDKQGRHLKATGASSEETELQEYWTLGKRDDGGWRVLSIEQDVEGAHHLDADLVTTPWNDEQRLRDEALVEGAVADKVVDGYKVSEIADLDFDGDARAAALDLSLADARFGPDILETAVRRAVSAWAEAVDGEDTDLHALATPGAVAELLHPGAGGNKRRLVVRGPQIKALRILALDAASEPPTMTVEVDVRGRRYVQDRDTAAILSGDADRERDFTEHWVMGLDGSDENPWRIVDVASEGRAGVGS
jgi:predicted lipid-binding transport protein (Tim44 family)